MLHDIETKIDGRRLENRVAELEEVTHSIRLSSATKDAYEMISNLQQQVAELTERVDDTNNDMTIRTTQIIKDLYNLCDRMEAVESPTPPQPAAVCPKCHNTGTITKSLTGYGMSSKPCDCGRAPVLMNQPAADDAGWYWDADGDDYRSLVVTKPTVFMAKDLIAGLRSMGMMRPIDPTSPELLKVVCDSVIASHFAGDGATDRAKRILSALAVALGGGK